MLNFALFHLVKKNHYNGLFLVLYGLFFIIEMMQSFIHLLLSTSINLFHFYPPPQKKICIFKAAHHLDLV